MARTIAVFWRRKSVFQALETAASSSLKICHSARAAPGAVDAAADLPRALQRDLPNFMQPRVIHWREAMPISPNGKLDRAGLYQQIAAQGEQT